MQFHVCPLGLGGGHISIQMSVIFCAALIYISEDSIGSVSISGYRNQSTILPFCDCYYIMSEYSSYGCKKLQYTRTHLKEAKKNSIMDVQREREIGGYRIIR